MKICKCNREFNHEKVLSFLSKCMSYDLCNTREKDTFLSFYHFILFMTNIKNLKCS